MEDDSMVHLLWCPRAAWAISGALRLRAGFDDSPLARLAPGLAGEHLSQQALLLVVRYHFRRLLQHAEGSDQPAAAEELGAAAALAAGLGATAAPARGRGGGRRRTAAGDGAARRREAARAGARGRGR